MRGVQSWALAEAGEGDMDLARDMLQKATEVQPKSVPCWHAWAKLELQAGDVDKARKLYLKALELNPRETFTQSKHAAAVCMRFVNCITMFVGSNMAWDALDAVACPSADHWVFSL